MKKVFASDFDGTLYFYRARVKLPPESAEKIREYQAAGHLFGLCTGRPVGGLTPFIAGLVRPDFCIASSGANIVDGDFRPILKRGVERGAADALVGELRAKGYRLTLHVEDEICVFAPPADPGSYRVVAGMDDVPGGLIHQISVHTESPEDAAALSAAINARFGERVEAFQNVDDIDIAPRGCSKGRGVLALREHLRRTFGDFTLFGIGDSINDLPLLEASDVSYTFPYAPEVCRDRATRVVDTIVDALEDSLRYGS